MESNQALSFDQAMARYESGAEIIELIKDFESITIAMPDQSAGWTCLAWLQLLSNKPNEALRSARIAVKLNNKDPQSRINLSLALLETQSKGVRDHIDFVKRMILAVPELKEELQASIADGMNRKPNWKALIKVKSWLEI